MVSLSEKLAYAVKELDFLFGDKPIHLKTIRNIPHRIMVQRKPSNYASISGLNYFDNKADWMELKADYIANGPEHYLTFGNLKENRKTKMLTTGENLKKA